MEVIIMNLTTFNALYNNSPATWTYTTWQKIREKDGCVCLHFENLSHSL